MDARTFADFAQKAAAEADNDSHCDSASQAHCHYNNNYHHHHHHHQMHQPFVIHRQPQRGSLLNYIFGG